MSRKFNSIHRLSIERLEQRSMLAAGELDSTFGNGGVVVTDFGNGDAAYSVAIASDGKIVAFGQVNNTTSPNANNVDFAVARYNSNGTLDNSFSGDGNVTTDIKSGDDMASFSGAAGDVAVQPDGRIIVAGRAKVSGSNDFALVRYNLNGSLDASFGGKGKVTTNFFGGRTASDDFPAGLAIQPDGKIVVAGQIHRPPYIGDEIGLARYNVNGSLDSTFDGDGKVITSYATIPGAITTKVHDMALAPGGKIVVVGSTSSDKQTYDAFVARYNSNGSLDTTFGQTLTGIVTLPNGPDEANAGSAVCVQSDGKIIVASVVFFPNQYLVLARYNTDGTLDSAFGTNGIVTTADSRIAAPVRSIVVQTDGKIVALDEGPDTGLVMRFNSEGSLDATFGVNGIATTGSVGRGQDAAIQSDGKIVVAGLGFFGSTQGFGVARLLGDSPAAALLAGSVVPNVVVQQLSLDVLQDSLNESLARRQTASIPTRGNPLEPAVHLGHVHEETLAVGVRQTDLEHDHVATVDRLFAEGINNSGEIIGRELLQARLSLAGRRA